MKKLDDPARFLLRAVGFMFAVHGYQKIFGGGFDTEIFSRFAASGLVKGVADKGFPVPLAWAWAAALSELVGGLFVGLGLFTRISAAFCAATMAVAAVVFHAGDPFVSSGGASREPALLYFAAFFTVMVIGPGKWSLDTQWRRAA